ncbi:MAG: S8 family serine peptidase [Actinobacteria bacterium]|nr:S8 family serine peptidase [Actinomycetota bacterium]MCB8998067.1 S8 family serine peptidase [Actinomycetota bacterium]MCB9413719.1 S8 family serine peptidase [Actinomycetota bacterium]
MYEARVRQAVPRGLVALCLACATAIPLGAIATPTAAIPTHRVLLSTTGEVTEVASAVTAVGGTVVQTFEIAQALLADLPEHVTAPEGSFVVPNVTMRFNAAPTATTSDSANTFRETIGAPAGPTGSGVTVAVIDTGVDDSAPVDVAKHVNVSEGPVGDGLGHGTFMAGLVAGDDDEFGGVAPGAEVLDVQVAAQDGSTDLARVLAGLQAVADERASNPSLDVAMLALSTESPLPPWMDPLTRGLDRLWSRGVTVVVAAGNDGKNGVTSPATDPLLLVAGAQDEADTAARADDTVPDFSSYGRPFGTRRPDVVAPGVSLISTAAPGSLAYIENPASHVGDGFLKGTGTSMSAAVTAGAVATLLAERPDLTPDQAKRIVIGTAYTTPALKLKTGAGNGGLDLNAALTTPLSAVPALPQESNSSSYGPTEADAQAWADFAQAWEDGDLKAVAAAWVRMSEQTRKWAANAWSLAALIRALRADDDTFDGRRWAGRRWAIDDWAGRRWATDEWVGRRWADDEWLSEVWDGRRWAGRRWAAQDWLAFAWTLRMSATDEQMQELWGDEAWDGRRWAGRRWAIDDWAGRRWAAEAWEGRRWADFSWDGRRWADGSWTGRRWADFTFEGRRWATELWSGRRWAVQGW